MSLSCVFGNGINYLCRGSFFGLFLITVFKKIYSQWTFTFNNEKDLKFNIQQSRLHKIYWVFKFTKRSGWHQKKYSNIYQDLQMDKDIYCWLADRRLLLPIFKAWSLPFYAVQGIFYWNSVICMHFGGEDKKWPIETTTFQIAKGPALVYSSAHAANISILTT